MGVQLAALVKRPYLQAIVSDQKIRLKAAEISSQIPGISQQHFTGVVVGGRIDGLEPFDNEAEGQEQQRLDD